MRGSSGQTVFENKVHACTVILHFPLTITLCIVHGFRLIVDTVLQSALHIMLIIIQFSRIRCQGVKCRVFPRKGFGDPPLPPSPLKNRRNCFIIL